MQINTETKAQALAHLSETKQDLVKFVQLLSETSALSPETIKMWADSITYILNYYQQYLDSDAVEFKVTEANRIFTRVRIALVPKDESHNLTVSEALEAYNTLFFELTQLFPQAFMRVFETDSL